MAKNQTGIAIVIKAFLPAGKSLDDQHEALSLVKRCHASGDYADLLKAAGIENVKTEMKTRRVEPLSPVMQDIVESLQAKDEPVQEAPPVAAEPTMEWSDETVAEDRQPAVAPAKGRRR